jgi:3-oxoadipate enol-lactonase
MPTVHANGIDMGYDIDIPEGADETAPVLVLLHGATSIGADDWAAQRPLLGRQFRCYLPDARGHGRTRWDVADGWTHGQLVGDLAAFVDALGIDRFHLAGFSMGAMTALTYASSHAERLRTLLVASITTQREPRASVAGRLMNPALADNDPTWRATLARRHDAGQGVDAWRRLLPAIAADVVVHPLLTPREMREIEVPTLICVGDRDPFVPVDHAWGMMRQLPDARLLVAPDCGHEIMARRPALFNEAMMAFYRSVGR